jgi:hypothetical protein
MNARASFVTFLTLLAVSSPIASAADWKLTVQAGDFDRANTVVAFTAPDKLRGAFSLRVADGAPIPFQIDATGRAIFLEPSLKKGKSKTYTLSPASNLPDAIKLEQEGAVLKASAQPGNAPIFHYQTEPNPVPPGVSEAYKHGAFLHPVFSPSGRIVTANHPPDPLHQRGIFFAWTKTDFEGRHPDFWNMGKGPDGRFTGEVRFAALERTWSGPVQGGFISRHRFIDHTSGVEKDVLAETWEVAVTRTPSAYLIDLTSLQKTFGDTPLKLPKYFYGGLGVRGAAAWDPVDQVTMLTSEGKDRKTGDNSKAKWVHIGGNVDGQPTGIAVLIHPSNFRFPQPLRLNPKNPQLCVAPSQEGDWEIAPGTPYISRYRLIIADGPADAPAVERQWNDYANPPAAELREQ